MPRLLPWYVIGKLDFVFPTVLYVMNTLVRVSEQLKTLFK